MKGSVLLVVMVVSCACMLFGQSVSDSSLPQAPSVSLNEHSLLLASSTSTAETRFFAPSVGGPLPVIRTVTTAPRKPENKVFDKKMVFFLALSSAATIADLELTSRCLRANTCSEANPLFGRNPTRARMYGISIPLLGGQVALSAWLKHRNPKAKAWMMPMISGTAAHGAGALTTVGK